MEKIMPFLENSNMGDAVNLATIAADDKTSSDEKSIIQSYLTVGINAHPARDYGAYDGSENYVSDGIQNRTIFNVPRQLVQEQYMNYRQGGTFGKDEETV